MKCTSLNVDDSLGCNCVFIKLNWTIAVLSLFLHSIFFVVFKLAGNSETWHLIIFDQNIKLSLFVPKKATVLKFLAVWGIGMLDSVCFVYTGDCYNTGVYTEFHNPNLFKNLCLSWNSHFIKALS